MTQTEQPATEEKAWYEQEGDELDHARKKAEDAQGRPRRFYLPVDVGQPVTFLTERPKILHEHNWQENNSWRNWETCLNEYDQQGNIVGKSKCPRCLAGNKPYLAHVWLVIDHSEWEDNEGSTHKDEVRLYVCKIRSAARVKQMAKKRGGIKACQFDVFRSQKMAPSTGDQFDFTRRFTEAEQKKLKWWPSDKMYTEGGIPWDQWFAPKSEEEIKAKLADQAEAESDEEPIGY